VDETEPEVAGLDDLTTILARAKAGDRSVLPAIQHALDDPALVERFGNLPSRVERTLINRLAGKDLVAREAIACRLELAHEPPQPVAARLAFLGPPFALEHVAVAGAEFNADVLILDYVQ